MKRFIPILVFVALLLASCDPYASYRLSGEFRSTSTAESYDFISNTRYIYKVNNIQSSKGDYKQNGTTLTLYPDGGGSVSYSFKWGPQYTFSLDGKVFVHNG